MVRTEGGLIAKCPRDSEMYPLTQRKNIATIIDDAGMESEGYM